VTSEKDGPSEDAAADRSRVYLGVLAVETVVILALWAFGAYFTL
jgi:hypothetical protein